MSNDTSMQQPLPTDVPAALFGGNPPQPQVAADPIVEPAAATGDVQPQQPPTTDAPPPPVQDPLQALLGTAAPDATSAAEVEAMRTALAESKAALGQVHPLALQVSNMLASGQDIGAVQKYLQVQAMDVSAMAPLDVLRTELSLKYPELTPAQIDIHLVSQGVDPEAIADPAVATKAYMMAVEGRKFLESQKAPIAPVTPQAIAQSNADAAQAAIDAAQWGKVVPQIVGTVGQAQVSLPIDTDGNFTFDYEFSKEAREQVAQALAAQKFPLSKEGVSAAQQAATGMLFALEGQKMMEKAIATAWEDAKTFYARKMAGPPPPVARPNSPTTTTTKQAEPNMALLFG